MGKKSYEREDFFGNKYWEDEDGNRTYEREDFLGNKYYEDQDGNRTYEREDFFGRKYREDSSGNREYEREDSFGNKYREDNEGNRTYEREDFFGNKYEEKDEGGCFLTTACVQYAGLGDDCHELSVLRTFRDDFVIKQPKGETLIKEYYKNAPVIVAHIQNSKAKERILSDLFYLIKEVVHRIEVGHSRSALNIYKEVYKQLCIRFGIESA